ncbi:MAG TPA: hypothetical protein VJU86_19060 [Pyrinomonadaceae bacterium]|nr:hypothetical protein [Pyrinomonadaceae bacterium]
MKVFVLAFCLVCGCMAVCAQSPVQTENSPEVAVLKFSWAKERINWQQDPFGGPIENFDEMRVRSRNQKRIEDAKKGGIGAEITKAERDARTDAVLTAQIHQNKPGRYQFLYSAQVRNSGSRIITAVEWDYVFFDVNNQSETGRRRFRSEEKIAPGKSKELKYLITSPPTQTVSIHSLGKNERANLGEEVLIVRVEYADGSFWQLQ